MTLLPPLDAGGVHRWSTIFLLDGKSVIRYEELRSPVLDRIIDQLLKVERGRGPAYR